MRILTILLLGNLTCSLSAQEPSAFFSSQEIAEANTAQSVSYLTAEEKDIFLYNNLARMQPKKFHKFYEAYCEATNKTHLLKTNHYYTTLSTDLLNRQPSPPLLPDRQMFESAECWAIESGEKGILGHKRITCTGGYGGENCAYGPETGKAIVMLLLIDFGVESLGHRSNMLSPSWRGMGTAIRPHIGYRMCAVQNFSTQNDILRAEAEKKRIAEEAAAAERARLLQIRADRFEELLAQFSEKERSAADIGRDLNYLSPFEKEFYFYYNLARMYPRKFKQLIWDEGPYFDRFKEEQTDLRREADFQRMSNYLQEFEAKDVFVPNKKYMDAGDCVVKKWRAGANSTSCLPMPGAWRLQTFYSESTYNDIIGIFLDAKDFQNLFIKNGHLIVIEDEGQAVKVFLN